MKRSFVRSTIFNILFYGITLIACVALLPTLVLPRKAFLGVAHLWVYSVLFLERTILGLNFEIRGEENLPKTGAFIVAAKHQSAYETFKLHLLFDDPAIVLKRELLRIPLWGSYLKKVGVIAIDRSNARSAMKSIKDGAALVIAQERPIVVFPQGTRVKPDENSQDKPYKNGVHRLQKATGLPVIPLALNSGVFWPRSGWRKGSGTVTFEFLPAIEAGLSAQELNTKLEEAIEKETIKLMKEAKDVKMTNKTQNKKHTKTFVAAAILLLGMFAAYSFYWFKAAGALKHQYNNFIASLSSTADLLDAPKVTGFPLKMHLHAPEQTVALNDDGKVSVAGIHLWGWPFPMAPIHIQTDTISIEHYKWKQPIDLEAFSARVLYKGDQMEILESSIDKSPLNVKISGDLDLTQYPVPRPDLQVKLDGHNEMLADLVDMGVIKVRAAVFIGAALSTLADENDVVTFPIHQKEGYIRAGSLRFYKVMDPLLEP